MNKLDPEEQEIVDAFETGSLKSVPNLKAELKRHREYAAATFQKDSRINSPITFYYRRSIPTRTPAS